MGFYFCAGLSLFIYMYGEGLVGSGILIESLLALCCLVRLCENQI